MSTITVENTNYQFEDIPGKGKCLVPIPEKVTRFEVGDILTSDNFNPRPFYVVVEIGGKHNLDNKYGILLLSGREHGSVPYLCDGSFSSEKTLEELSEKLIKCIDTNNVKFYKVGHGLTWKLS
jgi:hypothetical protein